MKQLKDKRGGGARLNKHHLYSAVLGSAGTAAQQRQKAEPASLPAPSLPCHPGGGLAAWNHHACRLQATVPSWRGLPEFSVRVQHTRDSVHTSPVQGSPLNAGCQVPVLKVRRALTAAGSHPKPSFDAIAALTRLSAIHVAALEFSLR